MDEIDWILSCNVISVGAAISTCGKGCLVEPGGRWRRSEMGFHGLDGWSQSQILAASPPFHLSRKEAKGEESSLAFLALEPFPPEQLFCVFAHKCVPPKPFDSEFYDPFSLIVFWGANF